MSRIDATGMAWPEESLLPSKQEGVEYRPRSAKIRCDLAGTALGALLFERCVPSVTAPPSARECGRSHDVAELVGPSDHQHGSNPTMQRYGATSSRLCRSAANSDECTREPENGAQWTRTRNLGKHWGTWIDLCGRPTAPLTSIEVVHHLWHNFTLGSFTKLGRRCSSCP